jgi:DNA-3-methyladenine glycosylase
MSSPPFARSVLASSTLDAARTLLGARLVRDDGVETRIGRIVEVEAYVGLEDMASHAHSGSTGRNAVMFGPPGRAYVYLVYGMYHCLNVVTGKAGLPAAVLVRAVEPLAGADQMRRARIDWLRARRVVTTGPGEADPERLRRLESATERVNALPVGALAAGPGLVCVAFSISRTENGLDLCDPASQLRLEPAGTDTTSHVATGPRVGVGYAPEPWRSIPWRFWLAGNAAVSAAEAAKPRREAHRSGMNAIP